MEVCIIHKKPIPPDSVKIHTDQGYVCADCYNFEVKLTPKDEIILKVLGIKRFEMEDNSVK
jgi:hypothetical protein